MRAVSLNVSTKLKDTHLMESWLVTNRGPQFANRFSKLYLHEVNGLPISYIDFFLTINKLATN
jgi:hypothetical protein